MSTQDPDWLVSLYPEIRRIAERQLRRLGRDTLLQPTAVVNELWIRLASGPHPSDPVHARALAAKAVRRLLVDHLRRKRAAKRGGAACRVELDDATVDGGQRLDMLVLEEELARLAARYPRAAEVVELRIFGGLDFQEISRHLGFTDRTIRDDWKLALKWLRSGTGGRDAP